ncbi:MAG: cell shape determination protein CcmA [Flammeovirgaceae bacterium]|nr:cell shape determination protein CcmA [Flammeovirgaceae bacterium]
MSIVDNSNGSNNIIGEGSVLKGNLSSSGNVRLEGKVIGDLSSSSKVACGETSVVDGNVVAENAEIAGKVTGKVTVDELLILKSTASIHGDISTSNLIIESGANFNGACTMGKEETIEEVDSDDEKE